MKSKHFKLYELFPKELYEYLIDKIPEEVMWRMVNPKLIVTLDKLKDKFPLGTITVNNWYWGGNREWSGLRTPASKWYSKTSRHSKFDAVDAVFSDYDVEAVRQYILNNQDEFEEVGGIELGVSWLHTDVRNRHNGKIIVFTA